MRIGEITTSATLNPSSYDAENSVYESLSNVGNGYSDTNSTTSSYIYLTNGSGAETIFFYRFDTSSIPSNATINSISCSAKASSSTTKASYVATRQMQMCTGTTLKGEPTNLTTTATVYNLTCGTWTRAELNTIGIRLYAVRGTSNVTTSRNLRFYGATLTIGYTYDQTYYTATITSSSSASVSPLGEVEYKAGEPYNIAVTSDIDKIRITDNGVNVTDQLVKIDPQTNISGYGVEYGTASTTTNSLPSLIGKGDTSTTSINVYSNGNTDEGSCRVSFDFSSLPEGLEPTDLYVRVKCSAENSSNAGEGDTHYFSLTLRNNTGTTTISSTTYVSSTTTSTYTLRLSSGKYPKDYYRGFRLYMTYGYYGGVVYGATAYLGLPNGGMYISPIIQDTTIHIKDYVSYLKIMGCWEKIKDVWVKNNGVWTKNNDYEFVQGKVYLRAEYLTYDSEIAYLESTGTQYIDLPLSVPAGTYMDVEFTAIALLNSTDYGYGIFGTDAQNQFNSRFYSYNSETNMSMMSTDVGGVSTNGGYNLKVGIPSTIKVSTTGITHYNGTFSSLERPTTAAISSFRLFGVSEVNTRHPIRVCMFRIHVGDNLVYDLIPVRIGDKGYMYDKISHVLFGNAGTGDFVLGGDKPYVTYLESNCTQYIDTGIVPDADTGILVKATSSDNIDTYLAGLRDTSGDTRWVIGHDAAPSNYYYGYGTWATGGSNYTSMSVIARLNYNNIKKFAISEFDGSSQMNVTLPTLSFTPQNQIRLFGGAREGSTSWYWNGRIYAAQITQDNVLVRDYVPTSVNGVGYMYDKVTKQLYGNGGTGSFIIGTDRVEKPYDAEVEYIKSSGTEYIDTSYIPTVNTHIIMKAAYKGTYNTSIDLQNGSMKSSTNYRFHWGIIGTAQNGFAYHFACGSKYASTIERLDANAHIFELWGNGQFKIDSRTSTVGTDASDTSDDLRTTDKSITLFARNDASSVGEFINDMELYYFQIYESDALVMDFIPVRVGVTSYLYDKIGNKLYGNLGTGYLTHGDDINTDMIKIEYLESDGNQYIDTGIIPDEDTGIYLHSTCASNADLYIVGLREDESNTRWSIGRDSNGYYYGYGTWEHTNPSITSLTAESYMNWLNDKKFTVTDGDNTQYIDLPTLSFVPTLTIRVFGSTRGYVSNVDTWAGKIYGVKISQGSNIVMDLIPVRIGQVGYLYDKVSNKLFGNNGTGSFILGDDII